MNKFFIKRKTFSIFIFVALSILVFFNADTVRAGTVSADWGYFQCTRHEHNGFKNCFGEFLYFPSGNQYTASEIHYKFAGHRHGSSQEHGMVCTFDGSSTGDCAIFNCSGASCGPEYGPPASPFNWQGPQGTLTWNGGPSSFVGAYRESFVEDAEIRVYADGTAFYPDAPPPPPPPPGDAQPFNLSGSCSVVDGSTNSSNLSWTASSNATSYTVQEHVWSTGGWYDVATGLTGTTYSKNVPNSADYYYRVLAYPGSPTVSDPNDLFVCGVPPPNCGNGVIDGSEECDGGNLNGGTCQSQGFSGGGTLSCNNNCTFNTSGCSNPPAGCQGRCFQFLGQTIAGVPNPISLSLVANTNYPATVSVKNNGTVNWYQCANPADPNNTAGVKLGSQNPQDVNPLIPPRLCPNGFDVPPGSSINYNFNFTTPVTPGSYNFQFSMVEEGVTWFYDNWRAVGLGPDTGNDRYTLNVPVTVTAPICGGGFDGGLRLFQDGATRSVAIEPGTPISKMRLYKDGELGVVLVDTTDPNASKMRVQTAAGTKALCLLP